MKNQLQMFAAAPMELEEAIELTSQSLNLYGPSHPHWGIAWSGGKDSTVVLSVVLWLTKVGRIAAPKTLTVLYADTRMELPPLAISANLIIAELEKMGVKVIRAMADIDKRFFVYMLGRGVPPPNNNTLRWCTRQIKIDPMQKAIKEYLPKEEPILMLTGVRLGESAVRDNRITASCTKDGSECGAGHFQVSLGGGNINTLAPILHWRYCLVWDWISMFMPPRLGWDSKPIEAAYGIRNIGVGQEIQPRTGCIGCPLASEDSALDLVLKSPEWAYIRPLKDLKVLYRKLRQSKYRLRKDKAEMRADGSLSKNPNRLGPLTLETRLWALDEILSIQSEVNEAAVRLGRPTIDILNSEEEARIRHLISEGTMPQKWSGDEPVGNVPIMASYSDGTTMDTIWGG